MAYQEMSPLMLAILKGGGNGSTDPALIASLPKLQLAQSMMQQGVSDAPTSKWGALSRLGQALVGNLLLGQGEEDVRKAGEKRQEVTGQALSFLNPQSSTNSAPQAPAPGNPPLQEFAARMGKSEAPNAGTVNPLGYSGQFQFGASRLADPAIGVYQPAPGEDLKTNQWKGSFNIPGFPQVRTQQDFLANPDAQNFVFQKHVADVDQNIAGLPGAQGLSKDGLRAVAHLGGNDGMRKFVETGGQYNPADANGTKLSDYYQKFGGGPMPQAQQPASGPSGTSYKEGKDLYDRAYQIATHPALQGNEVVQNGAKMAMERAKLMMSQGQHVADQERGSVPTGYRLVGGMAQPIPGAPIPPPAPMHTITMQDPDGKSVGIYEAGPNGPGRRIGNAPKQPGEGGPFAGTGMEAQASNVLLAIGPKITDGTATPAERGQYALAHEHLSQGRIMPVPDPTDPTGQRQVLARIPGAIPPQFPAPAPVGGAGGGVPAVPASGGGPAVPGGPAVIPGTQKAAPPTTEDERKSAGFAVRMRETGKALNDLEAKDVHSGNFWQSVRQSIPIAGNYLTQPDNQVYQQQMQDWVRAKLRRESGAVIGKEEMADEIKTYFPQPGDSPEKIAAKRRSRETAQLGIEASGGRAKIDDPARDAPNSDPEPPPGFRRVQ